MRIVLLPLRDRVIDLDLVIKQYHFEYEGLLSNVIAGHCALEPRILKLALDNKIQACYVDFINPLNKGYKLS